MTTRRFLLFMAVVASSHAFSQNRILESLQEMKFPGGTPSGQPFLFSDSNSNVFMSWVESVGGKGHALRFSQLHGNAWSEPKSVVSGEDFFVNWADVPSMTRMPDGTMAAHWLRRSAGSPYAYDINIVVSRDGGSTWSRALKPHGDTTKTEHGFASFFEAANNIAGLVWLDGRAMTSETHDPGGHGEGSMALRTVTVNRDANFGAEIELDDRVCECCPTAVTRTPNAVIIAYRNRTEEEVRDIQILRSVGGVWDRPFVVHADGWQIPGCPVNGPALSSRGQSVAVAWFTAADGEPRVFVSFSHDEGKSFGEAIRVDESKPLGRVALAILPDKSVLVVWIEYREGSGELLARRVWNNKKKSEKQSIAVLSAERTSGYPRVALAGSRIVLAWTETNPEKKVKVAIGTLR